MKHKTQDQSYNRNPMIIPDHLRAVPRLQYRANTPSANWEEFKEALGRTMSLRYGRLANLFIFGEFDKEVVPTQPANLDSAAGRLYLEEIKNLAKRREEDRNAKQFMYAELATLIPRPMWDRLCTQENFREDIVRKQDTAKLWAKLTSEACGANVALRPQYQYEVTTRFITMRQSDGEPLASFKMRLEHSIAMFTSVGLTAPGASMIVQTFLKGASDRIYGEAKANLRSQIADGIRENPESLSEAYEALESRVTEYNTQYRRQQTTTAYTMKVPQNTRKPLKDTVSPGMNTDNRSRNIVPECKICKKRGIEGQKHWHRDCPNKGEKAFTMFMARERTDYPGHEDPEYDFVIRLDTQSDKHVFQNRNLLSNLHGCYPVPITGVGGHVVMANQAGSFGNISDVLLCETLGANILSFALIRDLHQVSYNDDRDEISVKLDGSQIVFARKGNHYELDVAADRTFLMGVRSVAELEAEYTKKEVQRFRRVGEVVAKLGYPSPQRLLAAVRYGSVCNLDVTSEDVHGYLRVYGNIPFLKGKMTDSKVRPPSFIPVNKPPPSPQRLNYDIMFVDGEAIFTCVSEPLGLITVRHLVSRKKEEVQAAINDLRWIYTSRGFRVIDMLGDLEGAVKALKGHVGEMGIVLQHTAPTAHNPTIERAIRTVKDSMRSIKSALPYDLPPSEIGMLAAYSASRLNMMPSSTRVDPTSPLELFTGLKSDINRLGPMFGSYCEVFTREKSNSMEHRSTSAIALGSTGGSYTVAFLDIKTGHHFLSAKYKELSAVPDFVIEYMNSRYRSQCVGKREVPAVKEDNNTSNANDDGKSPPGVDNTEASEPTADVSAALYGEPTTLEQQPDRDAVCAPLTESTSAPRRKYEPRDSVDSAQHINNSDIGTARPYNTRSKVQVYHTSVAKAIQMWGKAAEDAIVAEMESILGKGTFAPADLRKLSKRPIRSFVFLKEKQNASGVAVKIKARLVTNGKEQDRSLYDDLSSPTCSVQSLFIVAMIAAIEAWIVVTMDVGTAYLNADMERDDIYIILDADTSRILVMLDKRFSTCINSKGQAVVLLKKALYGCIESALLWYKHLHGTLTRNGYRQCPYDRCVYMDNDTILLVYVDDIFVAARTESAKNRVVEIIRSTYNTITVAEGPVQSYLGMSFDFTQQGKVMISMTKHINELLGNYKGKEKASPADNNIFRVTESNNLSRDYSEIFHSTTAKLLYIAKRARPDLLTAVAFLTTRVQHPTEADNKKLERVLGYLLRTRDRALVLEPSRDMQLSAYVDASYDVHEGARSHTGVLLTLGKGALYAKSSKQKLVTKSSTEAELVALADATDVIMWARCFLSSLGYVQRPTRVYQDNKSTMTIATKGYDMHGRTKHVSLRYFSVSDLVQRCELTLSYLPTEEMIADILTKPLQGQLFNLLCDGLMGTLHTSVNKGEQLNTAKPAESCCTVNNST